MRDGVPVRRGIWKISGTRPDTNRRAIQAALVFKGCARLGVSAAAALSGQNRDGCPFPAPLSAFGARGARTRYRLSEISRPAGPRKLATENRLRIFLKRARQDVPTPGGASCAGGFLRRLCCAGYV